MSKDTKHVLVNLKTYKNLRRFLIDKNEDIVKGDILNAVNEAVEQYIAKEKAEGEKL